MSRLLTLSLLASTMLITATPIAAQERGGNRGEWRNQSQQQQRSERSGGNDRQRDWSSTSRAQREDRAPREQRNEASGRRDDAGRGQPAPQVAAPVPEQRAPSAVATTRVPRSNVRTDAQVANGRNGARAAENGRRSATVAPFRRDQQENRNWNDAGRNNSEWRQNDRTRNDGDRRQGDWGRDNRDRSDRGRDNANNDDRRQRDWQQGGRARNDDRDRNDVRNGNNWSRQQDWNSQRRLNERQRWSDVNRWDNRWRSDRRYDWQRHRNQYRNIYRMPSYYAPYGWSYGYRRFSIGIYLSNMLFSSNYWIDDPYYYRLPAAYGPLRWVRYYDDALLVDVRDGYVVDVIHNFFW